MNKQHECIHYEMEHRNGQYVDYTVDGIEFGACHKCFRRLLHKKGIAVIRFVCNGIKMTPVDNTPF